MVIKKDRLVAQGYSQEEDIDYTKTFAHVARFEEIRLLMLYVLIKISLYIKWMLRMHFYNHLGLKI